MGLKEHILEQLEQNRGRAVSGEELGETLNVSRAAVWKAINALREEGFNISAVKNRGYTLSPSDNKLSAEGILSVLRDNGIADCQVFVYDTVDSTQNIGKKFAAGHTGDLAIITADSQTKGRGRYGKNFYSPHSTGIYMSLVIKVGKPIENFLSITTATAVAVCRVIERHSKKKPEIKWVNDVWFGGRKACGILTEAVSGLESGLLDYVVIGIGMNLHTKDFPEELKEIAFSIDDMDIARNVLIAELAAEVFKIAKDPDSDEIFNEYKDRSLILGKEIWWMDKDVRRTGTAIDLNRAGNLIVRTDEGEVILNSGDVSIRPL